MLFVLLTIFTEDNTGQLTRQSLSWGSSTVLQWAARPVLDQVCVIPGFKGFYKAVCPGSKAWAASNAQWSQEKPRHWLVRPCSSTIREKAATCSDFFSLMPHWVPWGLLRGKLPGYRGRKPDMTGRRLPWITSFCIQGWEGWGVGMQF